MRLQTMSQPSGGEFHLCELSMFLKLLCRRYEVRFPHSVPFLVIVHRNLNLHVFCNIILPFVAAGTAKRLLRETRKLS